MLASKQTNKTRIAQQEPASLLEQCSQVVAGWIRKEDCKRIPVDLYEPLQRQMDPERQRKVFGQVKHWHANGQLWWVESWKEGKKHGETKGWYDNGQLSWIGHWKGGKKPGEWKKWYANGQLAWVESWKDGQKHGETKGWHDNGQLAWVESWKDGRVQGERQYYPRNQPL